MVGRMGVKKMLHDLELETVEAVDGQQESEDNECIQAKFTHVGLL